PTVCLTRHVLMGQSTAAIQLPCSRLEDRDAVVDVWERKRNHPVESTRSQEGRIDVLRTIRGGDHNHVLIGSETIHKRQKLGDDAPRDLVAFVGSTTGDAIYLIEEDDRSFMPCRVLEDSPEKFFTLAVPLAENLGPTNIVERRLCTRRN